jgi:phospholipid transport system transporter-binding protein
VSSAPRNEVLALDGALSFETLPDVLKASAEYAARADLPDRLTIDFGGIDAVDSSAVALLLEWRRQAQRVGKALEFVNLPANLVALATLYGVEDLIEARSSTTSAATATASP